MFTRRINGNLYALVKVPDDSTQISFSYNRGDDMRYLWIENAAGIRKRAEMSLDVWSKISLMSELPEEIAFAIGMMELSNFLTDTKLKAHHALLFVWYELHGLMTVPPWER